MKRLTEEYRPGNRRIPSRLGAKLAIRRNGLFCVEMLGAKSGNRNNDLPEWVAAERPFQRVPKHNRSESILGNRNNDVQAIPR